eukprot:245622_1
MADDASATTKGMDIDEKSDKKIEDKEEKMEVDSDDEEEEKIVDPKPSSATEEKVNIILAEIASTNALSDGVEKLLYLEKKARQSEEEGNTLFICKSILNVCKESGDWNMTVEQIAILSRRRSQFRRVTMRMVQYAMRWLDDDEEIKSNRDKKIKLIDTLISVTQGKIFVEVERARLTRKLAQIRENDDKDIAAACDILQELQIETFGSMRKAEKCDFLLEQFRLNLAKKDFIRGTIVRNKITVRILKNLYDLECKYWNLSLILFYHHEAQYLALAKSYFRLKELLKRKEEKQSALSNGIFAMILAEYSNESNDLLHRTLVQEKKLLESLPILRQLLSLLSKKELIEWPLNKEMMDRLTGFAFVGVAADTKMDLVPKLKRKVIEHNIRVAAQYYQRISTQRLAQFLGCDVQQTENYVSTMVTDGHIFGRINRLDGIIRFKKIQYENKILNAWKSDTDKLLDLVDLTCHQIHKEMVIHKGKNKKRNK